MSDDDAGNGGIFSAVRSYLSRTLAGTPQTYVEGGGTTESSYFERHSYSRGQLAEYRDIYERGGPIAALIDTRALMAFGTGVEFVNHDDRELVGMVDGETVTITDWLDDAFDGVEDLLVQVGKESYVFGRALGEIVESDAGGFSHVELIEPWTMRPDWDEHGEVQRWEQEVERPHGTSLTQSFDPDEVAHFRLQRIGRKPIGISLIEQNYDEIQRFAANQDAIQNTLKLHGFPKYHVKVGREDGGSVVNDTALRRVRSRFRNFDEKTNWVTGRDIDIENVDTGATEIDGITEHDLMVLAAGFGVPEEMAGLGRGSTEATAKVRLQAFERMARSEQRILADQFIEQVIRPVLARYTPFPRDANIGIEFGDVVSDQTATAEWLQSFREYYTVDEVREKLGDGPAPDDDEIGLPEGAEASPAEQFGGLFNESGSDDHRARIEAATDAPTTADPARALAASRPRRVYIDAADEAPDEARVLSDDGGGLYYLADGDPDGDTGVGGSGNADGGDGTGERHPTAAITVDTDPFEPPEGAEADLTEAERAFNAIYRGVCWDGDAETRMLAFAPSDVPESVRERLISTVQSRGLFPEFDAIPDTERWQVVDAMVQAIETGDGWTVADMAEQIEQRTPATEFESFRIARTEMAGLTNRAREEYYEEEFDPNAEDTDVLFRWVGPQDHRTTDACEWLKAQTKDGVTLERLIELEKEASDRWFSDLDFRKHVIHPFERHTFVRHYAGV